MINKDANVFEVKSGGVGSVMYGHLLITGLLQHLAGKSQADGCAFSFNLLYFPF